MSSSPSCTVSRPVGTTLTQVRRLTIYHDSIMSDNHMSEKEKLVRTKFSFQFKKQYSTYYTRTPSPCNTDMRRSLRQYPKSHHEPGVSEPTDGLRGVSVRVSGQQEQPLFPQPLR